MNSALRTAKLILARLETALEYVVIVVVAVLVLDVLWQVFTRSLWGDPSRWTDEVARLLLIWVTMLGAAVAFRRHEHLGVDFFVSKLDPNAQRLMEIVVELVVIAFASVAMVYGGYVLVSESLRAGQVTPALGLKMGFADLAVPVSGLFIVAFSVQRLGEILFLPLDESSAGGREHPSATMEQNETRGD